MPSSSSSLQKMLPCLPLLYFVEGINETKREQVVIDLGEKVHTLFGLGMKSYGIGSPSSSIPEKTFFRGIF